MFMAGQRFLPKWLNLTAAAQQRSQVHCHFENPAVGVYSQEAAGVNQYVKIILLK
jgi:hypothetical protein